MVTDEMFQTLLDRQEQVLLLLNRQMGDLQESKEFINGNGHEGARTRLKLLETAVEDLPDKIIGKLTVRLIGAVGVPMLIAILIVIYEASVHIRVTP